MQTLMKKPLKTLREKEEISTTNVFILIIVFSAPVLYDPDEEGWYKRWGKKQKICAACKFTFTNGFSAPEEIKERSRKFP